MSKNSWYWHTIEIWANHTTTRFNVLCLSDCFHDSSTYYYKSGDKRTCQRIPTTIVNSLCNLIIIKKTSSVYDCTVEDVEYIYNKLIILIIYYWCSALGPVWAETRAQSGDWYGSGTLHPGQVLRGSLPLLSPAFLYVPTFHYQVPPRPPRRERSQRRK